ncbi:hypothetical protein NDU88_006215 [Pleurodeles waltl]|uniref:Uncharacterized protein n=1 Tax=Pleurodeles waltl TaxID=8319 RepID=A0AAV7QK66_PLEWA|nr:hypothetical protein NDU88_006215 [Pleurodeles waltl]
MWEAPLSSAQLPTLCFIINLGFYLTPEIFKLLLRMENLAVSTPEEYNTDWRVPGFNYQKDRSGEKAFWQSQYGPSSRLDALSTVASQLKRDGPLGQGNL